MPSWLRKAGPSESLSSATSRPEGHTTATQMMTRKMTAATRAIRSWVVTAGVTVLSGLSGLSGLLVGWVLSASVEVRAWGVGCWVGTLTTLPPASGGPRKAGGNDQSTEVCSGISSSWR